VGEPPVGKEAEQVDVLLVSIGQAVKEDHHEGELVQIKEDLAALS
jgi:hypothetical protein